MRGTAVSHAGLGQILMDERNRHRALAHSGGAALDRSAANVARREYPLQARLQAVRLPRKSLPGVFLGRGSVQRSPRQDEAAFVEFDGSLEPACVGLRPDEDEKRPRTKAMIPPATLPMARFPTTVALQAPKRSIANSPFSLSSKPRNVKPVTLTPFTRSLTLRVSRFTSPTTQMPSGPKVFEQGESALALGGRFDHGVVSAQLDPVLADHHVLSVNSPDHDGVARIGGVYGLLDGLARPNDRALRSGGADPRR
jgi:hypothetical protein